MNPIRDMPTLAPEEIRLVTDAPAWWARHRADEEAVVFGGRRTTWRELAGEVERCSRALLRSGVEPGDRVAYLGTSRPEYLVVFLATARLGALWLGLNPKYHLEELTYVVGDAQPKVLLGQTTIGGRDYADVLHELQRRTESVQRLVPLGGDRDDRLADFDALLAEGDVAKGAEPLDLPDVHPLTPCLLVYTSGSTGRPKGAMLTHHGLTYCAKVQVERWYTQSRLKIVNNFPINHVGCTGDICCYGLLAGGTIVFQESFDPAATLAAVERERCTVWGGVPTMLQLCAALPDFDGYDLSSVEAIAWSGAAAPRPLVEQLAPLARLSTTYGMTETTGSITYTDDDASLETLTETMGRPESRYELRIAGADGTPCAPGEEGELQARGSYLMAGYYQRPEANAETFDADGWMHTGDLAVEDENGNYRFVGRLSEMYKSGGYNVYPREIEIVLEEHPAIALAAVVDVPDPLFQEVGHAFLLPVAETEPGGGAEVSEESLRQYCRERLANYKVPKRFVLRHELPMLPVGKVDKMQLRKEARAFVAAVAGTKEKGGGS